MSHSQEQINSELHEILAEARAIKLTLKLGGITYDEAKIRITPLLERLNETGELIAQTYGRKYKKISFIDI